MDCEKTSVKDGIVSYGFLIAEGYGLYEEAVQAKKRVRVADGVSTAVKWAAVPVTIRGGVLRADLASVRHEYDAYRRQERDYG